MTPHVYRPAAIWRRPARHDATTPLVVFLHGRGADEHDLFALADGLPASFAYVSIRGSKEAEGGFTWFDSRGPAQPIATSLQASVSALSGWLDDPATTDRRTPVFLLGFSAGMMMAGALLLTAPTRYAGAVLLSGALPLDSGLPAEPGRLAGLPIFHAHGTLDTVIPAPLVAQTHAFLQTHSGADLSARTYRHAHSISPREVADIAAWLAARA